MTRDDVMRETVSHVRRVSALMMQAISGLQTRAIEHDDSKFSEEEFESFAAETPLLKSLSYNTPPYEEARKRLGVALEHHYANNRHHPEFHPNGIQDMDLLDLIEMLADWKAATERHADGSLARSLFQNAKRFKYNNQTAKLLARTALNLKWITQAEFDSMPDVVEVVHEESDKTNI